MFEPQAFNLPGALILQFALSFYYIYFIIRPLSEIEKISGKINYGYRLFIIRIILLVFLDILDPTFASFLDISVLFTLSFVTIPKIKKELNYIHTIDTKLAKYDELTNSDLTAHGIKSRKSLENTLFKTLVLIQTARTNYDYDTLKYLCTEKLYNLYTSELNVLHQADLGYHFENYKLIESQIYSLASDDKKITIKMAVKASCISYRLAEDGEVLDGSKTNRTIIIHELEFEKSLKNKDIDLNCDNCGAPTKRSAKGKCAYCNTIIEHKSTEWVLSKNKVIAEKVIHNYNE